jgi:NTE family protein
VSLTHSLRKRQLIASYVTGKRGGAYWGIHSRIEDYALEHALRCPPERTDALASIPARLKGIEPIMQERLINWGYAVCDASLRRHVEVDLAPPDRFPYPDVGVG